MNKVIDRLLGRFDIHPYRGNVHFVPGFFKDSLTTNIVNKLNLTGAGFINIDVDLYCSTLEVLEFLISNK